MPKPLCTEDEFIALFVQYGTSGVAKILNTPIRSVQLRRARIELSRGIEIRSPIARNTRTAEYPVRVPIALQNGHVLVGSDAHYWPGEASTAHRAFIHLAKELKPHAIILNGDVMDGASISRHPPIGWAKPPSVKEELQAVEERLDEIKKASPKSKRFWTIGNHDSRFENKLSSQVKEFEDVKGTRLKDHFPEWDMCWSIWINEDVVIKHRFKGGVHAAHNNSASSGKSMVTGHLHSLKVTPYADYNGNRFGVDTGTLAEPYGDQFAYSEDNPLNHRSGFVLLTFHNGALLWPEVIHVLDGDCVEFRGKVIRV